MSRPVLPLTLIGLFAAVPAAANPLAPQYAAPQVYSSQVDQEPQTRYAAAPRRELGGGFIEFLFNGTGPVPRQQRPVPSYPVPSYVDPNAGRGYEYQIEREL